jgi:hypothetical protein
MRLSTIRSWAQTFVYLDFLCCFAWAAVAATLGLLLMLTCWLLGQDALAVVVVPLVLQGLALLLFVAWMTGDARRAHHAVHSAHRKEKPGPDGDLTDVASAPALPPWMGVL